MSLVTHLARFGRALRRRGVGIGLSDEADALAALTLVDLGDRGEVRLALRAALKIRPRDGAAFEELFARLWSPRQEDGLADGEEEPPRRDASASPPRPPRSRPPAPAAGARLPAAGRRPAGEPELEREVPEGEEPGYSPEARLRRKSFEECSAADLQAMERLMRQLALRLATRPSRRRVAVRGGRGEVDLRRSFRRAVAHGGEFLSLARRARRIEEPRLLVLCDTSGSMDPHTRFLLAFVLALRRAARHTEVFAFNTALVRLTPVLRNVRAAAIGSAAGAAGAPGAASAASAGTGVAQDPIGDVLRRLADGVPDWSGGTRIGECLADFVTGYLDELVNGRTVVLILSDGLDRGDVSPLAGAMRAIRARARRVLWLNPLAGDRRFEPTARAMAAAMPFLDELLPAHNLESLERLLPLLAA
jgi:uncharacterized protein with von Willebrand factor type A (vWA) domain